MNLYNYMMKIASKTSVFIRILPGKKYIVLESSPTLTDNTAAVFYEMINRHWTDKYKFLWVVNEEKKPLIYYKNVSFAYRHGVLTDALRIVYALSKAVAIIDCNVQIPKINNRTIHFFLGHGSLLKNVESYYTCKSDTDYLVIASPFFGEAYQRVFKAPLNKQVVLGLPRNDELFDNSFIVKELFHTDCQKIVAWYPTFRKKANSNQLHSKSVTIPMLDNYHSAQTINSCAKDKGVLLVVKPHPAQDVTRIKDYHLSNIVFIDNDFLKTNHMSNYQMLGNVDALITDYSSVFFDFLLTGKPIGLTINDFEEYNDNPGFAYDPRILWTGGYTIDSVASFSKFLDEVLAECDTLKAERKRIMEITNTYSDKNSTNRVVDFVEEAISKRY